MHSICGGVGWGVCVCVRGCSWEGGSGLPYSFPPPVEEAALEYSASIVSGSLAGHGSVTERDETRKEQAPTAPKGDPRA